jgi:hypothetical protein
MKYSWSLIAASNSFHSIWEFSFEISAKERILHWLSGLPFDKEPVEKQKVFCIHEQE